MVPFDTQSEVTCKTVAFGTHYMGQMVPFGNQNESACKPGAFGLLYVGNTVPLAPKTRLHARLAFAPFTWDRRFHLAPKASIQARLLLLQYGR